MSFHTRKGEGGGLSGLNIVLNSRKMSRQSKECKESEGKARFDLQSNKQTNITQHTHARAPQWFYLLALRPALSSPQASSEHPPGCMGRVEPSFCVSKFFFSCLF